MAKLTRGGVCYDLEQTPFIATIGNISFHFSSNYNLEKFALKRDEHQDKIEKSLSNRFGFTIRAGLLADIVLYKSIEKRGFMIAKDGTKMECLSSIILDGNNLIKKI